jgi:hypothetical protein
VGGSVVSGAVAGGSGVGEPGPRGSQLERTALSWQRTALSASVVALFLLREGLREGLTHGTVLTTISGLCLVALAVLAAGAARAGKPAGRRRLVLGGAALVGVAGTLLVLQLAIGP